MKFENIELGPFLIEDSVCEGGARGMNIDVQSLVSLDPKVYVQSLKALGHLVIVPQPYNTDGCLKAGDRALEAYFGYNTDVIMQTEWKQRFLDMEVTKN